MEKTYIIAVKWNEPRDINFLSGSNVKEALSSQFKDTEFEVEELRDLTGSEAIFAFFGFLAQRNESITIGDDEDPKVMMELIGEFCRLNNLNPPRNKWEHLVKRPEGV